MDCVESQMATNENRDVNKSMDCCVMITNEHVKELLLIELKLNIRSLKNFKAHELVEKTEGSLSILRRKMNKVAVHNTYVVVFNNDIKQQAIFIKMLYLSLKSSYKAMTLAELNDEYFNKQDTINE
ncbi:MAG: hypothetical protein QM528_03460 [Phycisphaerales bacterium]|nr:hypothetical protein [Phycisphaerales bacterium]